VRVVVGIAFTGVSMLALLADTAIGSASTSRWRRPLLWTSVVCAVIGIVLLSDFGAEA
jgi:hypothetical protein